MERREIEADLSTAALRDIQRAEAWLRVDDVRQRLPSGTTLVDFFRYEPSPWDVKVWLPPDVTSAQSELNYAAWVVGKSSVRVEDLGSAVRLERLVRDYVTKHLGMELDARGRMVGGKTDNSGQELFDVLWKPLDVSKRGAILVSPDGVLGGFPVGILRDRGKYMLENRQVSYFDSTWLLDHADQASWSKDDVSPMLLVGGVDFSGHGTSPSRIGLGAVVVGQHHGKLGALPGTDLEVAKVTELVGKKKAGGVPVQLRSGALPSRE